MLGEFAKSLKPGENALGASGNIMLGSFQKADETKKLKVMEMFIKEGYKDKVDPTTGLVKTPSSVVQGQLNAKIEAAEGDMSKVAVDGGFSNPELGFALWAHTASVFFNTLISQVIQRVYDGMFDFSEVSFDAWDEMSADVSGREAAQERISNFITPNPPPTISDYNQLSEFVTCVPSASVTWTVPSRRGSPTPWQKQA